MHPAVFTVKACLPSPCTNAGSDNETTSAQQQAQAQPQAFVLSPLPATTASGNTQQQHAATVCKADQFNLVATIAMDDDMEFLCQTMRINENTRALLTFFDARTIEDFSMMTELDLEAMVEHSARTHRPFPPLQQRKVAIVFKWLKALIQKTSQTAVADEVKKGKHDEVKAQTEPDKLVDVGKDKQFSLLPPDWRQQFLSDLPMLKADLHAMGENSTWSVWTTVLVSVRWLMCGYED